tara:strand:+ start:14951 stop:15442 length:492 start_codon:yes stop_codon:yes gene_type:complete
MIYRMRAILDTEEDVIRDFEIEDQSTLEELHDAISQSFGFAGNEMASFYRSDEQWNQGEELPLVDMGVGEKPMNDIPLDKIISESDNRLIYVYDFLNLWTFFVELIEIAENEPMRGYPSLIFTHGEVPETAPNKEFSGSGEFEDDLSTDENEEEDDYDSDDFY